ncbi:MAG: aminotransferase class V-fold PLP-dependent enzyme [Gracilibacteraceae bacterium]|jgi:cysteine desulfurase family protein|nr:aminotransferase class V-fold PLP-dependent enzyme [Gracilibacteraceae bacterium]
MDRVYLDNAATSYPKAPGVGEAVKRFIDDIGCNIKRGVYKSSLSAEEIVFDTREQICRLFNFDKAENVIFTQNITQSLNFLMKGFLKRGDHCIVSSMEHNAVMRPLAQLNAEGVEFSRIQCDSFGRLNPEDITEQIKSNTKAVIMTHASNVCGTVLPIYDIGKICKEKGIRFIVDSAQSAGTLELDWKRLNADAIAFTGHKGLLGPQGIGGFVVSDEMANEMSPYITGGTGSFSDSEEQPEHLPDKFESGTSNIPGIFGLNTALKYVFSIETENIRLNEMKLTGTFISEVSDIKGVMLAGIKGTTGRTAVVSLDFKDLDNAEIAYILDKEYGIATRCGLHCAPSAHKTLGTFPQGTVRFSFSHFNTMEEVRYTVDAINRIIKRY